MPKIIIENLHNTEIVFNNSDKTLINQFAENNIDWMQACGQKGRCVTCKAIVVKGDHNLSDFTAAELKYKAENRLMPNERLCCQAKLIKDEVVLRVPENFKLPHIKYS